MNYGKALEEVWESREAFEKQLRRIPRDRQVEFINKTARDACKKLGIKCRKPSTRVAAHA